LAFCWCLTAAAVSLYGGGARDSELARADGLIQEKKYDEAIQVLTAYIKSNPDNFDKAQKRLRHIMEIQGEFNAVAEELLDTMMHDPDNTEKILSLISRMESLKSSRNVQVQNFIARTQDLAQFSHNRNRLLQILEEGRALVAAGDYRDALSVYAGGLDIYQDEFFAEGYGEIIENRVRREIEELNRGIASFPALTGPLNAAAADIAQAARQTGPDAAGGVSRLGNLFDRFISASGPVKEFRDLLYETAAYFDEQLNQFQQGDKTIGDRSFLSFASRLIRGGGDSSEEGMLGAVEAYWNNTASGVEKSLAGLADQSYRAALADVKNRDYGRAGGKFQDAAAYAQYPLALLEKWREFAPETAPEQVLFDQPVLTGKIENFLAYRSLSRAAAYLIEDAALAASFEGALEIKPVFEAWQGGTVSAREAMARETLIRQSAGGLLAESSALLADAVAETTALKNYQAADGGFPIYMDEAVSLLSELRDRIFNADYEPAVRFYTMAQGELEKNLASRMTGYGEGNRLIQGIPRTDSGGGDIIDHYPAEGLALLTRMDQEIAADTQWGDSILSQYAAEGPELRAAGSMPALAASIQALVQELNSLQGQGRRLAATARNQIAQAESFRLDGERLFRESRAALSQGNFDVARSRIQRATDQFHASLTIQESDSLRAEWDTQVVELGAEINRLENEIVIRDVRNLVNNARNSYFTGDFEQAEGLLVQAQNRWRVTNVGTDGEIQYWLNVVRGALSLRTGKVISPTAPLYAEMSQLLSDAKKNYEEGVRYLNASRRAEGLVKLAEARMKTQEVKLMFPVNQEAGMLELRIDQVMDPPVFAASFGSRVNAAVAGSKQGSMESFAELQNLAEIDPRYPGIAAALAQAEIDVGLRPPVPSPQNIARSNELTAAARQILNRNIVSQFEVGIRQCDEAITLNPNNTQAMTIKDQLQTKMNGTGTLVIDSRSEAEYQRAVRELQQGNNLVALAIVEQLLQDPNNRSSTRILDLQRRIQARL
jgi:TolA-binding protein